MGLASDLRILYHMTCERVRGNSHQERLEAFYRHQADGYDDFRKRLLHGREEMMRRWTLPAGGRLLDMGGGTGSNIECLGDRLRALERVTVVDLCPSLLETARRAHPPPRLDERRYRPGRRDDVRAATAGRWTRSRSRTR